MIFFFIFILIFLNSQDSIFTEYNNINLNNNIQQNKITINVKNTKESYFFNEDILLKLSIVNNTTKNIRFFIYDNFYKNFSFSEKSNNNELEKNFNYIAWQNNKNDLSQKKRLIELKKNESFTVEIKLNDFFIFNNSNQNYFFDGIFLINSDINILNNITPFNIKIKKYILEKSNDTIDMSLQKLPPYEVVKNNLFYQKKKYWNFYFDTIHLPDYLINNYKNTDYYKRFYSSYENKKIYILEQFKSYLIKKIDYKINKAKIKKTIIENNEANIIVWLNTTQYQYVEKMDDNFNLKDTWQISTQNKVDVKKTFNFKLKKILGYWKIVSKTITIGHIIPNSYQSSNLTSQSDKTNNTEIFKGYLTNQFYYNTDESTIDNKYLPILDNIIDLFKNNNNYNLKIIGYASSEGSLEYNYQLALQRAEILKKYFIENGLSNKKINIISKGSLESKIKDNPLDRRVDLFLELNVSEFNNND